MPNDLDAGILSILEGWIPVSPDHLLLMTWRFEVDSASILKGGRRDLATSNAFVVANAESQWFHEVGVDPWLPTGVRSPLSPAVLPGYGVDEALESTRRQAAAELVNSQVGKPLSNDPVEVLKVSQSVP